MKHSFNLDAIAKSLVGAIRDEPAAPAIPGFSKLEFLGEGGIGQVWQGWWDEESRWVALKVARSHSDETAERFAREGAVLAQLEHPNIVRVLGGHRLSDGTPVLVMELVKGATLANLLPPTGLPPGEAVEVFREILKAVMAAHKAGVVHRDLKPANVLVSRDGAVKVVDFGLASPIDRRQIHLSLTQSGVVAGSVEYLPPEAYAPAGESSVVGDIYALGVILYELLVGAPPRGAWRPASEIRHVDVRLDALIAHAMRPDPAARLRSAAEFERRLDEITTSPPRYAGSPLLTLPVRVIDALWTATGVFCLLLGVSTTLHLDKSLSALPLNLFGAYPWHMCRWLGFRTILICLGVMMLWQIARLWRFRRVPLREALPSPFGLRLGTGRTAAALTLLSQAVLVLVPTSIVWTFWRDLRWWDRGFPEWQHVLRVESYEEHPVSAWDWKSYWEGRDVRLAESHIDGRGRPVRRHSRIDFRPGLEPSALIACAGVVWAGLIALALASILRPLTGRSQRTRRLVTGAVLALCVVVSAQQAGKLIDRHHMRFSDTSLAARRSREAEEVADVAERALSIRRQARPALAEELYEPGVYTDSLKRHGVTRDQFIEIIKQEQAARSSPTPTWKQSELLVYPLSEDLSTGVWTVRSSAEYFEDGGHAAALQTAWSTGAMEHIQFDLRHNATGEWRIFAEVRTLEPCYRAQGRKIDDSEVRAWLEAFCACLSARGGINLEEFFNPHLLSSHPRDRGPSGITMAVALRSERAQWSRYELSVGRLTDLTRMPGARIFLRPLLLLRRSQSMEAPLDEDTILPEIEIAFIDGRWQIVRLKL